MNFGERVAFLRTDRGLTQQDLAMKLFVSKQTVSKWENNKSIPDPPTLANLAKELETTTDYLLGISNIPINNSEDEISVIKEKITIAERSIKGIVWQVLIIVILSILLMVFCPMFLKSGSKLAAGQIILIVCLVVGIIISFVLLLLCFSTPQVAIQYFDCLFIFYYKGEEIKVSKADIARIWTEHFAANSFNGRIKIFLNDGSIIKYFNIEKPMVVEGTINTLIHSNL